MSGDPAWLEPTSLPSPQAVLWFAVSDQSDFHVIQRIETGMQPCGGEGQGRGKQVAQRGTGRGNDYQRQQQALRRAQEQQARQVERERKAAETASKRQERERKAAYQEQQAEQAQVRTIGIEHEVEQLGQLLRNALVGDPPTTFERRRRTHTPKKLDERPWSRSEPSPRWEEFAPPEPGGLAAVLGLGRKRHEAEVEEARVRFGEAQERHRRAEERRLATLERKRAEHRQAEAQALAEVAAFNGKLDEEREAYRAGEPAAVEAHLGDWC
jgi:restriction system protein